ncbi:MAG: TonB family protein [Pyrinomonadaceae bacterium]
MLKFAQASRLLIVLIVLALPCFAQDEPPAPAAEYDPKAWHEFTSAAGRFAVLLPGTPTESVTSADSPIGQLDIHTFMLRTFAQYGVTYIEYPKSIEDGGRIDDFLAGVRDGGVKGVKGTLREEKAVALDGHPGRYLKVQVGDGSVMRIKFFVVQNRLYQLGITMRDKDAPAAIVRFHEETAAKFLDSFKLITGAADEKRLPYGDPKGYEPTAAEGEVDRLLRELKEKGEGVLGRCLEGSQCQPINGQVLDGQVAKGTVTDGQISNKPQPAYPPIAKAARAMSAVAVQVIVNKEGKVIAAQVLSGHPLLQAAALKAARAVLCSPTLLDGKPVNVSGVITYNFVLQ